MIAATVRAHGSSQHGTRLATLTVAAYLPLIAMSSVGSNGRDGRGRWVSQWAKGDWREASGRDGAAARVGRPGARSPTGTRHRRSTEDRLAGRSDVGRGPPTAAGAAGLSRSALSFRRDPRPRAPPVRLTLADGGRRLPQTAAKASEARPLLTTGQRAVRPTGGWRTLGRVLRDSAAGTRQPRRWTAGSRRSSGSSSGPVQDPATKAAIIAVVLGLLPK
jgi:hypothetical protein